MIRFTEVGLQLGNKPLFNNVNFILHAREKVGLIGQNGTGKSTLFSMLQGLIQADQGDIFLPKNLTLATVKQETPSLPIPALEYILDGDAIYRQQERELAQAEAANDNVAIGKLHEWMAQTEFYAKPALAASLLHGLGFKPGEELRHVAEFSGGWRMRLNLAQALIADSNVLLLDEPTNHLDLEAVLWLESWLKNYPGILLLISHDREFLDQVIEHILWLEQGTIKRFTGNYSAFESQRAMHFMQQQVTFTKQQRERDHLQHYIDRFRAKATKAKQAQSRIKALERMEEVLPAYQNSAFNFHFPSIDLASKAYLLQLIDADLGYAEKRILSTVQFSVSPGQRIGLLGPNGAGKSTLIKALAGTLPLLAGTRTISPHLKLGYFSQHQLDILALDQSPFWHIRALSPHAAEPVIRKFFGQFNFQGDRVFESIEYFSGGEKARLALALMVWQKPNLLLLDEPTNHLDIEMRQALIMALQEYEGAVIVISHDRYLLRATTDDLYLVYNHQLSAFPGSIDDYPAWWKRENASLHATEPKATKGQNRKTERQEAAKLRAEKASLQKKCQQLEVRLGSLQKQLAAIEISLADEALYQAQEKSKLNALIVQKKQAQQELLSIEEAWLLAIAQLEEGAE